MSVVGSLQLVETALDGALAGLLLAPSRDAGMCVTAKVVGSRRPLRSTQLPICGPRLVVDADYAARGSLRRHEHSVADRAMTGHPSVMEWPSIDLLVTGHPAVGFKGAAAAPKRSNRPP